MIQRPPIGNHLQIVLWNTEWRSPFSQDGQELRSRIASQSPDIVCLPEASLYFFGTDGYAISSEADYGYPITEGRRKVLLWSRTPWRDVDTLGDPELPSGRFVTGITDTSLGALRVIGVCVPWADAHVRSGRRDRERWQDHLAYLSGLKRILQRYEKEPVIVVGDFNQRIPRSRQPENVFQALSDAIPPSMKLATEGSISFDDPACKAQQAIDHLIHGSCFASSAPAGLSNLHEGRKISDHIGISVALRHAQRDE